MRQTARSARMKRDRAVVEIPSHSREERPSTMSKFVWSSVRCDNDRSIDSNSFFSGTSWLKPEIKESRTPSTESERQSRNSNFPDEISEERLTDELYAEFGDSTRKSW